MSFIASKVEMELLMIRSDISVRFRSAFSALAYFPTLACSASFSPQGSPPYFITKEAKRFMQ